MPNCYELCVKSTLRNEIKIIKTQSIKLSGWTCYCQKKLKLSMWLQGGFFFCFKGFLIFC
jgi:hypothetical protein